MNHVHDIVMSLLETPFSRRQEDEKREVLQENRPTPQISVITNDKKTN